MNNNYRKNITRGGTIWEINFCGNSVASVGQKRLNSWRTCKAYTHLHSLAPKESPVPQVKEKFI